MEPEGNAIVYCEGAFNTTNGKTAHGLIRRCKRYRVVGVVDRRWAGRDAGEVLDGRPVGITVFAGVREAVDAAKSTHPSPPGRREAGAGRATHLVVGLAPDGGRLSPQARLDVIAAIGMGLNVDCGLHDFLSEDPEIAGAARRAGVTIRDVRRTPPRSELHAFTGKIEQVTSLKVAVLGTDSAVGKRTTAWKLVDALRDTGHSAELIGTGQTAWLQGAKYSIALDSLISDFMAGEIEHAVWSAWNDLKPDVIVIEGQGSLMNPAYPGGYEILAAGRPDVVILQHAPARTDYDGFPGYPIHPLEKQIEAIEMISSKPVVAITINHEGLNDQSLPSVYEQIRIKTGLTVCDVLLDGAVPLIEAIGIAAKT